MTVIGLIPVAALIGQGGLGQLMRDGFERDFRTPLVVGVALTVALRRADLSCSDPAHGDVTRQDR